MNRIKRWMAESAGSNRYFFYTHEDITVRVLSEEEALGYGNVWIDAIRENIGFLPYPDSMHELRILFGFLGEREEEFTFLDLGDKSGRSGGLLSHASDDGMMWAPYVPGNDPVFAFWDTHGSECNLHRGNLLDAFPEADGTMEGVFNHLEYHARNSSMPGEYISDVTHGPGWIIYMEGGVSVSITEGL